MSEQTAEVGEPTLVEWQFIDIGFRHDIDMDALFAAIEPPDDLDPLPPAFDGHPDDMLHRFLRWGWSCDDRDGYYRRTGKPTVIGVYWDYTTIEDDERLMPRIAPFVHPASRAIFQRKGEWIYEGWDFTGNVATLRKAEKITEWEWNR